MDLFNALLVTHTFRSEFVRDREYAHRIIEEKAETAPVASPQPQAALLRAPVQPSWLGLLLHALRGALHNTRPLPRPH